MELILIMQGITNTSATFNALSEESVAAIISSISVALVLLLNTANSVTMGELAEATVNIGAATENDVLSVIRSGIRWRMGFLDDQALSQLMDNQPRVLYDIYVGNRFPVGHYSQGQGIQVDWLIRFLERIGEDWCHEKIQFLLNFRRN